MALIQEVAGGEAAKDHYDLYPKPQVRQPVKAVSYTHLRAHETVLDIVCRLLLEKKKQNIKKSRRKKKRETCE